ncbi:hypothetical protein Fcan01_14178 [Folsomia candida]|uniref:Uncharacterized protein n=2 Tax=Folsomia candida TaxID=158441 RepID=A0A226E1D6_FOLCA|nr:hypothetical protein Fcan01_14178 [Folsomia candida]
MPPKLKTKGKSKGGKRKKDKGKKKKKEKPVFEPPPLHQLTELYNKLREKLFDLKQTQGRARKKRLEGWYMTREMLAMKHDNDVYHDYLKEKMGEIQRLMEEITLQLELERAEVDRLIRERMSDYDKRLAEYKHRMQKGEVELNELRIKLLEYEHLIKKLAGLLAHLKELQDMIPAAELDANVKTRHLKNQYLNERAKLHNHLESELFNLITTCRSHLMPMFSDHMNLMELDNRCNRWDLGRLDIANARLSERKEILLQKRNRLNMKKGYLSIEWAFSKLAQCETRKKEELEKLRHPEVPVVPVECELSIAFKAYLNKRLVEERIKQRKEAALKKKREERRRKLALQEEKARKAAAEQGIQLDEQDFLDDWDLDDEEMEYYRDSEGNLVVAPVGRMKLHKAMMENRDLDEEEEGSSEEEG